MDSKEISLGNGRILKKTPHPTKKEKWVFTERKSGKVVRTKIMDSENEEWK